MKLTSNYAASVAVCLITAITLTPYARANTIVPPPSPAVVNTAVAKTVAMVNKALAYQATQADVASATTAVETLFSNLQETGNNGLVQGRIIAAQAAFVSQGLSESQVQAQEGYLNGNGSQLSSAQYEAVVNTDPSDRQQAITTLQQSGLYAVEQSVISKLQTLQSQIANNSHGTMNYAMYTTGGARLQQIADELHGKKPGAHLLRVGAGFCAMMAALFAMAATVFPLFAIIAAIYALEDALGMC